MPLAVTRVVNACVLLEIDGQALLTDPYFDAHWFMRLREPIGLRASELPPLAAILGCHGAFDHWQPGSLSGFRHDRGLPVWVATERMARQAQAAGFPRTEVLTDGEERALSGGLRIRAIRGAQGARTLSWLIRSEQRSVFVGGEALDLEPLEGLGPVDLALLPVDGSTFLGRRLVMDSRTALEAAGLLGARTLVPFHYAVAPVPPVFTAREDLALLEGEGGPRVRVLAPGVRWVDEPVSGRTGPPQRGAEERSGDGRTG